MNSFENDFADLRAECWLLELWKAERRLAVGFVLAEGVH